MKGIVLVFFFILAALLVLGRSSLAQTIKPNVIILLDTAESMSYDVNDCKPDGTKNLTGAPCTYMPPSRMNVAKYVLTGSGQVAVIHDGWYVYMGDPNGTQNVRNGMGNVMTKILRLDASYSPDPNGDYFVFGDADDIGLGDFSNGQGPNAPNNMDQAITSLDQCLLDLGLYDLQQVAHQDINDGIINKERDVYQAVASGGTLAPRDGFVQHFWDINRTPRVFPVVFVAQCYMQSLIWRSCYRPDPTGDYFVFFDSTDYDVNVSDPDALFWQSDLLLRDYLAGKGTDSYQYREQRNVCGDSTASGCPLDGRNMNRAIYQWVPTGTAGATVFVDRDPTESEVRTTLLAGIPQVTLIDVIDPGVLYGPHFTFAPPGDHSLDYAVRIGLDIPQPPTSDPLDYLNSAFTYVADGETYHFFDGKDNDDDGVFDGLNYAQQFYEGDPGLLDANTNVRWGLARFDNGGSSTGSNCDGSDADFPGCGANLLVSLPDEYPEGTSAAVANANVQNYVNNMTIGGYAPLADSLRNLSEYFFAPANKADLLEIPGRNDPNPTMYVDHDCEGTSDDHIVQADPAYLNQCRQNFVIFVTDGDQNMGLGCTSAGNCNLMNMMNFQQYWVNQLRQAGNPWVGIKVFVVGFALQGNPNAIQQLFGMAQASKMSADDPYDYPYFADSPNELRSVLNEVLTAAATFPSLPCIVRCPIDTDLDGLPNDWENFYGCMQADTIDNLIDYDLDGLNNESEFASNTNPCNPDTDDDGLLDGWEVTYAGCGFDPLSAESDYIGKISFDLRVTSAPNNSLSSSLSWTGSEFGVSWHDSRDGNSEIYFARISSAGSKLGSDLRVTSDASYSLYPSLSWTGFEFGVSWRDYRDGNWEIYIARVSSSGAKLGSDLRVTSDAHWSEYPSLAWTGSEFGMSWDDDRDGNYEIYFVRVSSSGAKIGPDLRVTGNASWSDYPSLAWTGSEFGVSWEDNRDGNMEIYFALISASGVKQGSDVRITSNAGDSGNPSLAWTGTEYGVSWEDNRDGNMEIYFALISADGAKQGDDIRITGDSGDSRSPSLAWTGSEFGVSWIDSRDGNSDIYFAYVSSTGNKIGSDLRVTSNASLSMYPSLAWTGSEFGVSWEDSRDADYEIYFARIRASGFYTDKDGDDLHEDEEFLYGTNPCNPDSDGDTLPDGWEVSYSGCGLNPLADDSLADPDSDDLTNGQEYLNSTLPCDADTDNDGANDGLEVLTALTDPLDPDSDDDLMFDGWEIAGASCGLDPLDPDDAWLDSDTDTLANIHEYFNNNGDGNVSDPCDGEKPRRGWPGGGYFGDGDGNLLIGVPDLNRINLILNGRSADYSNAFPADPIIQDMDGNLIIGVPDKNLISLILNGKLSGIIAGSPTELSLVEPLTPPTVAEGDTVRIQVELTKDLTKPRAGFGVVFTIVSGAGTLLGGEGVSGSGRYDLTALDGVAQLVVRADGSGTILVQVDLPYDPEVHTQAVPGPEVQINVGP